MQRNAIVLLFLSFVTNPALGQDSILQAPRAALPLSFFPTPHALLDPSEMVAVDRDDQRLFLPDTEAEVDLQQLGISSQSGAASEELRLFVQPNFPFDGTNGLSMQAGGGPDDTFICCWIYER